MLACADKHHHRTCLSPNAEMSKLQLQPRKGCSFFFLLMLRDGSCPTSFRFFAVALRLPSPPPLTPVVDDTYPFTLQQHCILSAYPVESLIPPQHEGQDP